MISETVTSRDGENYGDANAQDVIHPWHPGKKQKEQSEEIIQPFLETKILRLGFNMCVLEEIAMQIDGVKAAGIADVVDGVKA